MFGVAASPIFSAVVVVTCVTAKAFAALVLAVKAAEFVGVKAPTRDSLAATGSVAVVQVAVNEATATAPHPVIVVAGLVPYVKATVPAAPAPVRVAVIVTLVPKGSEVIAVFGVAASPIFRVVVVVVATMVTTGSAEVLVR